MYVLRKYRLWKCLTFSRLKLRWMIIEMMIFLVDVKKSLANDCVSRSRSSNIGQITHF